MDLINRIETVTTRLNEKADQPEGLVDDWQNAAGRFGIWTNAIGAGIAGSSRPQKLVSGLNMSSHLVTAVKTLLDGLIELLTDASLAGFDSDDMDLDLTTNAARRSLSRASSRSASSDEVEADTVASEYNLLDLINHIFNGLHAMTPALLNPAPHDAITSSRYSHIALTQEADAKHLEEKYPEGPIALRQRLGRLNWHRRILRNCAKMHKESASSNQEDVALPATTPLVVRQDGNGVQWIAFEYSRDRVESEYTFRSNVESVNVDSLSAEFKNENCVYPRACFGKENYKGNRLNYETECNAVGWALAELNTCLRGKRGLIQRAVDIWRNSNQDPRLRSRRVRRQAKVQHRNETAKQVGQMVGPSLKGMAEVTAGLGTTRTRAPTSAMGSIGAPQLQHYHHARPEMSALGQQDSNAEVDYLSASDSRAEYAVSEVPPTSVMPADSMVPTQTNVSTGPSTLPSSQSIFDAPRRGNDSQSSIGSMSSYAATVGPQDGKHLPCPVPPPGCLEGQPFDCEICYRRITNVKGNRKWKRHVMPDLRPYVCTHGECPIQDVMFASRREWFEHEMTIHYITYVCISPCQEVFVSCVEFYRHLKDAHSSSISDQQVEHIAALRKTCDFPNGGVLCPLCREPCPTTKKLEKHLGGDLEQIALFSLPPMVGNADAFDGDDDDDDDDMESFSNASSEEMDVKDKMELFDRKGFGGASAGTTTSSLGI
ncbi:hypothetical protein GJ744_005606 [Endocarpon pusillum]|uniref:C2H2-type domain-containing protein n=1 Tax=Endocarpon pusillum TaxID=364733 RepID=A0A8H7DZI8_9EURO|nr:hypothetical protein GJ744_005606 [Endocarpon pusillum]